MQLRIALSVLLLVAALLLAWRWSHGEGVTPLMKAAHGGDAAEVLRLVADGADIDAQSSYGWTALMMAASQGRLEAAQVLLGAGADPDLRSGPVPSRVETTGDYPPTTALTEAISNRHFALAGLLLDHGAQVDAYSFAVAGEFADTPLLARLLGTGADINAVSDIEWGRTALSRAARSGNLENLSWLIAHGADPNLPLPGTSNLQEAVMGLHPKAVDLLLAAGADPDDHAGSPGFSPLWQAVLTPGYRPAPLARTEIVETLLRHGADPGYIPEGMDRSLTELVGRDRTDCEAGFRDPAQDLAAKGRYLLCAQETRRILDLLPGAGSSPG